MIMEFNGFDFDAFVRGYMVCALWSTNDESTPQGGEPMDANYSVDDIAPSAVESMRSDCAEFVRDNLPDLLAYCEALQRDGVRLSKAVRLSQAAESAGHDYWLTRNGHGAGFWDRGLGELGERLSKACRHTDVYLYVGDDERIYQG
jgi:hypothetical protein